jgi:hypothetical protein
MKGVLIMILYTIFPEEVIFAEAETENQYPEAPPVEIEKNGVRLMVRTLAGGRAEVIRVISTDPQDFMNPEWQPGMIL